MGMLTTLSPDTAEFALVHQLSAVGDATPPIPITGRFNVAAWATGGATGAVKHQRTFDGGTTWLDSSNLGVVPTIGAGMSEVMFSQENGVLHRLVRVSGTGTTFFTRLSQ
jgi:hypothetical protein